MEATLTMMEAQARARNARAEMDEISGLAATRGKVKQQISDLRHGVKSNAATTKQGVQQNLAKLKADVQRAHDRYSTWDDARARAFEARLDEIEAQQRVWDAQADQQRAELKAKSLGHIALLKEKLALGRARARAAAAKQGAAARDGLQDAASQVESAYHAASKHFGKR